MTWNTGSVAAYAYNKIQGVPVAVSGTIMQQYAEMAVRAVENWTVETIGLTGISAKYHPILVDMTALSTLSYMTGIGVDNSYKLGDLSVNKGTGNQAEIGQMKVLADSIQNQRISLGRNSSTRFNATFT